MLYSVLHVNFVLNVVGFVRKYSTTINQCVHTVLLQMAWQFVDVSADVCTNVLWQLQFC